MSQYTLNEEFIADLRASSLRWVQDSERMLAEQAAARAERDKWECDYERDAQMATLEWVESEET